MLNSHYDHHANLWASLVTQRADAKERSRARIVQAAADRLRRNGVAGTGVAEVMSDAGLTHGAFYSHFSDKTELVTTALTHAIRRHENWMDDLGPTATTDGARAKVLAERYLNTAHRDRPEEGCPYPPLLAELSGDPDTDKAIGEELRRTLDRLADRFDGSSFDGARSDGDGSSCLSRADRAAGLIAACIGGILMARALPDSDGEEVLLRVRRFVEAAFEDPQKIKS